MSFGASQDKKTNMLFKKANNVVDVVDYTPFTDDKNRYADKKYFMGKDVLSESDLIPDNLENISYTESLSGTVIVSLKGISAMHQAAIAAGAANSWSETSRSSSTARPVGYDTFSVTVSGKNFSGDLSTESSGVLKFFFRVELSPAVSTVSSSSAIADRRTWYLPDPNDTSASGGSFYSTLSFCRDSIPFNYDTGDDQTYQMILEKEESGVFTAIQYYGASSIAYLMDYQSGFIQLYGTDSDITNEIGFDSTGKIKPLYLSFVKYIGAKGTTNGGAILGQDANFDHLTCNTFESFVDASFNQVYIGPNPGTTNPVLEVDGDVTIHSKLLANEIESTGLITASDFNGNSLVIDSNAELPMETTIITKKHQDSTFPSQAHYPMTMDHISLYVSNNYLTAGDWVTIARIGPPGLAANYTPNIRGEATFQIFSHQSGVQDSLMVKVKTKYGRGHGISILEESAYQTSKRTFDAIRIAYNEASGSTSLGTNIGTYDGCLLQLRIHYIRSGTTNHRIQIKLFENHDFFGWELYNYPPLTGPSNLNLQSDNAPIVVVDNGNRNRAFWDSSHDAGDGTGPGYYHNPNSAGLKGNPFLNEFVVSTIKKGNYTAPTSGSDAGLKWLSSDSYGTHHHTSEAVYAGLSTKIPHENKLINTEETTQGIWSANQTAYAVIELDSTANYNNKWYNICRVQDLTQIGSSSLAYPVQAFTLSLIGWQNYDDLSSGNANKFSFDIQVEILIKQNTNSTSTSPEVYINTIRWLHGENKPINNIAVWTSGTGSNAYLNIGFLFKPYQTGTPIQETGKYVYIDAFILNNGNNALVKNRTGHDPTSTGTDPVYRQLRPEILSNLLTSEASAPTTIVGEIGSVIQAGLINSDAMSIIQSDTFLPENTYIDGIKIIPDELDNIKKTEITLDSSVSQGDWITLAICGSAGAAQYRANALFTIWEKTGSHHHFLRFTATIRFNSGIAIDVHESSWYASPRFLKLRIAHGTWNEGSILQLKVATTGSPATIYMQVRENDREDPINEGWNQLANGTTLATNNPVIYPNHNSTQGNQYANFKETRDLHDDLGSGNKNIKQIMHPTLFNSNPVTLHDSGLNINANSKTTGIDIDGANGNRTRFTQKEGSQFSVQCPHGPAAISGATFDTVSSGDTNIKGQDDVWIRSGTEAGNSSSRNGDIGIYSSNYLQLRAASNQSNSNSSGMTNGTSGGIQIGSRTSGTRRYTEMLEGLRLQRETIATLNGSNGCFGYPESLTSSGNANGILAYANDRTHSGVITQITNPITSGPVLRFNMSSPPQVMEFMCALKARTHASATHHTVINSNSTSKVRWHFATKGPSTAHGLILSDMGSDMVITQQMSPFPLLVQAVTLHPFHHYANQPVVTSGPVNVSFEIWVCTTSSSGSYDSITSSNWISSSHITSVYGDSIRNNTPNNGGNGQAGTGVAWRVSQFTRSCTNHTSLMQPFTNARDTSNPTPVVIKLQQPFIIPPNMKWNVYVVERITSSSGSVNFRGRNSIGYGAWTSQADSIDSVPLGIDIWYTALNTI